MAPAMLKVWDRLSLDTKEYALGLFETCAVRKLGAKRFPRFSVSHVQAHIVHRVQAGFTRHTDTEYAPWDVPGWRRDF